MLISKAVDLICCHIILQDAEGETSIAMSIYFVPEKVSFVWVLATLFSEQKLKLWYLALILHLCDVVPLADVTVWWQHHTEHPLTPSVECMAQRVVLERQEKGDLWLCCVAANSS